MALPLEFYETFETGDKGNFDSITDTGYRLDFPHLSELEGVMPWRGAYCLRVDLGRNINDAYLEKTGSWPSGTRRWGRFRLFVGSDVQFGSDLSRVNILQWYSSAATIEARITLARIDPLGVVLAVTMYGETWASSVSHFKVPVNEWFAVEFERYFHGSTGFVSAMYPDHCRITSDRNADGTGTKWRLGAVGQEGTLRGTVLFDEIAVDEDRLYSDPGPLNGKLSNSSIQFLQNGYAFVGPGEVDNIILIDSGSNDARIQLYDVGEGSFQPSGSLRYDAKVEAAGQILNGIARKINFQEGCFVKLSGTNPQVIINMGMVELDKKV